MSDPRPDSRTEIRPLFVIGDIHGHVNRLGALLGRLLALNPSARLIFLGDYVDRGNYSRRVVDTLLDIRRARPDTVFLMGNHESVLLRYAHSRDVEDLRILRQMGFQATLDSYRAQPGSTGLDFMPQEHQSFFLHGLKRWHREPGYVFFHAPMPHGTDPDLADSHQLDTLLSNRIVSPEGWAESGQTLVFGHVPLVTPLVGPGLMGLDTGAGQEFVLTALELPELRFHHA